MFMLNKISESESESVQLVAEYTNYMKNCGFRTEDSRFRIVWQ